MKDTYILSAVILIALVTAFLRFLPFIIFKNIKTVPPYLKYLSDALPFAVMGMLVVYCLRNTNVFSKPYGIPELIACAVTAILHILKRNTLFSIFAGTVSYMLMVQFVF